MIRLVTSLVLLALSSALQAQTLKYDSSLDGHGAATSSTGSARAEGVLDLLTKTVTCRVEFAPAPAAGVSSVDLVETDPSGVVMLPALLSLNQDPSIPSIWYGTGNLTDPQIGKGAGGYGGSLLFRASSGDSSLQIQGSFTLMRSSILGVVLDLPGPASDLSGSFRFDEEDQSLDYEVSIQTGGGIIGAGGGQFVALLKAGPLGAPGPVVAQLVPSPLYPLTWEGTIDSLSFEHALEYFMGALSVEVSSVGPFGSAPDVAAYVQRGSLNGNKDVLSATNGGVQNLVIEVGQEHGGKFYLCLGTMSGTKPGIPLPTGVVPLNMDQYFNYTLVNPNTIPLLGSFGILGPGGEGEVEFRLPPGANIPPGGALLNHAVVVLDPVHQSVDAISQAIEILLVP